MDIFIRSIPMQCTTDELTEFLRGPLSAIGVFVFECEKKRGKGAAILTIADETKASYFLMMHGSPSMSPPGYRPPKPLVFYNRQMVCTESYNRPSSLDVRCLEKREKDRAKKSQNASIIGQQVKKSFPLNSFPIFNLSCGNFNYVSGTLVYVPCFTDTQSGRLIFGKNSMVILLDRANGTDWACRIDILYLNIHTVLTGTYQDPSITLSLWSPPKMAEPHIPSVLDGLMQLSLNPHTKNWLQQDPKRTRISEITSGHKDIVGLCFVYRLILSDRFDISRVHRMLRDNRSLPSSMSYHAPAAMLGLSRVEMCRGLANALSNYNHYSNVYFPLRFQIQKLTTNGILPPEKTEKLLPYISGMVSKYGTPPVVYAVRKLSYDLPIPDLDVEPGNFDHARLISTLDMNAMAYRPPVHHENLVSVHHVFVTPSRIYLEGPEEEPSNRVLRRYLAHLDYFIRVSFVEEDGDRLYFDPKVSLRRIFDNRFKQIMNDGIKISGRVYTFLGFSHSSLRSQTCWFMAPFVDTGKLVYSKDIIRQLGDFSIFRCPAKCAARIGQAFSDSTSSVAIHPAAVARIPDIERNGRTFSDGCGTISLELLQKVWKTYAARKLKPMILQIRFAGAKGVVSLDSRLGGDMLCLRKSMEKFNVPGINIHDVEICGAAFKPLPMYLNRPLIKILEDLGIEAEALMELQEDMVQKLRRVTLTPLNAATFLEWDQVGGAARTPTLIRLLNDIGLPFQQDNFLSNLVEIAALVRLREIKHRSRILVNDGHTLYGIMDETGFLKEGEIYCVVENAEGGRRALEGDDVLITRSPALHPGDVRVVRAVTVPHDSPLNYLYNCVVFSQHGERDLPSMLSGGDLDGDLFNVIWDTRLVPGRDKICPPADYPRPEAIDIGREVTSQDMSNFFIQFMESDMLGRICTIHQQLADQSDLGVFDPKCIRLAEMASVAVDFSKTGIPVDMNDCPKYNRCRPDFMARGPRVMIEKGHPALEDDDEEEEEGISCLVSALDPDVRPIRYYESNKVLGKLYRAIDEKQFFQALKQESKVLALTQHGRTLMEDLWDYVVRETALLQWQDYRVLARQIRDTYEDNLINTMSQYSTHPRHPLSELEVFSGAVLGFKNSGPLPGHRQRQAVMDMKERFEQDCTWTVERILYGDTDSKDEALPRAIACLAVALQEKGHWQQRTLKSFAYVAAAVLLRELETWQGRGVLRKI